MANINLVKQKMCSRAMLMCGNPKDFQVDGFSVGEVLNSRGHAVVTDNLVSHLINT